MARLRKSTADARVAKALSKAQRTRVKSMPKDERPLHVFTARERRAMMAKPGAVVLFNERLNRTAKAADAFGGTASGSTARFSTRMVYGAGPGLCWDSDVRKMLRLVQVRCAVHFRNSMYDQIQPDHRRALPTPNPGDRNSMWGIDTGEYANSFRLSPVTGSSVKAECNIRPPADNAKNASFTTSAYRQGVELVSSRGWVRKVIQVAFEDWLGAAFGIGVQTPETIDIRGTYRLDQAMSALRF